MEKGTEQTTTDNGKVRVREGDWVRIHSDSYTGLEGAVRQIREIDSDGDYWIDDVPGGEYGPRRVYISPRWATIVPDPNAEPERVEGEKSTDACPSESDTDNADYPSAIPCMTLRQYAAIQLRVPNSHTPWLDEMIQQSRRDAFAGQAMNGLLSGPYAKNSHSLEIANDANLFADAMLAASEGGAS